MVVEPFFGNAFELPEQVQFGFLAGITPFRVEQTLSQMEEQRRRANIAQMLERHIRRFTDNSGVLCLGWADKIGG